MTPDSASPWIRALRPEAHRRLLCFSFAGGGAAAFRGWSDRLPGTIDVCPVILPGREHRMREPAKSDIRALVDDMLPALRTPLRRAPYAIYGHSMGSWVAFELVRAIRRARLPLPAHIYLGARRAPHLSSVRPPLSSLDRDAFIAGVQERYQAIPAALLAQPAILDMFLPTLRADFAALDQYLYVDEPPLDVPITTFQGQGDPMVASSDIRAWAKHTTGAYAHHTLPGGHFFLTEQPDLLTSMLTSW